VSSGRVVLHAALGALLGFLAVGLLGSVVALVTPVRAVPLILLGLLVAAVVAWLAVRSARRRAGDS
jgi:hypothetical protein